MSRLIFILRADSIRWKIFVLTTFLLASSLLTGCGTGLPFLSTSTPTVTQTPNPTATATYTPTPTITPSPTFTFTPTITSTPTITLTPSITPTPTFEFPDANVLMQANCRYGPGTAYLYAHGLYEGDHALVHGRTYNGTWLWVQPDDLTWHCWVSASVVEVEGDINTVVVVQRQLPKSTLYGPPKSVKAVRNGDEVTVTWNAVWMTEDDDRGYLIEADVCQNGHLIDVAVATNGTSYTFLDEENCDRRSSGALFTVEKHGYTDPVTIPWP